jgi:hypothetical protein
MSQQLLIDYHGIAQNFHRAVKRPLFLNFMYFPATGDAGHA